MSNKVFDFINLHNGEEEQKKVLENIKSNISFRGSNLWILACAIVIASVGLNVNSTAVIIGAMLISPLMGPIVGAGFALAIYDFELLKKSGKNLLIATIVSLVVASIYFFISPFKETQSELLARTSPNIYDVLIAFFGGLVGVIALTRVEKGNPIPGVAIATALMPPLCTAGYGLAIGNFSYFFGAFYLYTINCFFICISTFLIIKYLKYEPVRSLNPKFEKQIRYGITSLILIMIIPSFYLAYNLLNQKKFSENVERYIASEFTDKGYTMIYKKLSYNSNPRKIELAFLSQKFDSLTLKRLNKDLEIFGLSNTELIIKQDASDIKSEILKEINLQNTNISEKDLKINELQTALSEYQINNPELVSEINILFPEIQNVAFGKMQDFVTKDSVTVKTYLIYKSDKNIDENRLRLWLENKMKTKNLTLIKNVAEK